MRKDVPSMGSRRAALGVVAMVGAMVAVTAATAPPRPADGGCVAGGDVGGVLHCSGVLNNSLNGISIHILGG